MYRKLTSKAEHISHMPSDNERKHSKREERGKGEERGEKRSKRGGIRKRGKQIGNGNKGRKVEIVRQSDAARRDFYRKIRNCGMLLEPARGGWQGVYNFVCVCVCAACAVNMTSCHCFIFLLCLSYSSFPNNNK